MTPEQARRVVAVAVTAPSVHNTQPWSFEADGDVLDLRADRRRQLPVQDPDGRELLLSCGAAALHARLGVAGLDRACTLTWFPTPEDPEVVARLVVGDPAPIADEDRRLLDAVPLRHTDRSAFAGQPVQAELAADLRAAAEREGAWLVVADRPDQVVAVEVLVARADAALRADPQVQQELQAWVRPDGHPDEGIPRQALPGHGADRGSSLTLRDFDPVRQDPSHEGEPPEAERPLLLVLGTPADTPLDWVRAGAALARLLLTATAAGLVANPQTQAMEVPAARAGLRNELGLAGQPQVVLRVGWPAGPGSPRTGRRPVDEVLRTGADDRGRT